MRAAQHTHGVIVVIADIPVADISLSWTAGKVDKMAYLETQAYSTHKPINPDTQL
jgi:hypothetical protein